MKGMTIGLDRKRNGTHYGDRMHRILGVCQDCGLLWHEERISYRNGASEVRRVDDVEPVRDVLVGSQYEKYGLRVNPRLLPRIQAMATQFAYALNVPHTSVEVDGDIVYVRVPRTIASRDDTVSFASVWNVSPGIPRGNLLLGVDEDGHQLVLDLLSPTNVHAAVVGMTGSGKSTLMRTMILSALLTGGSKVALFDPSGGFAPLSGHPAVWRGGLFRSAEECELGLEVLARSIGRGADALMFVFVDEVPELVMQRPRIKDHLARLAQAGRHAGIHLVLGAQHPLASELGPLTMRNVPMRLVGKVADRTAAYNASGRSDTGAENLRGRGDFLAVNGTSKRHFQAACITPEQLEGWARRFPQRQPRLPVRPADIALRTVRPTRSHAEPDRTASPFSGLWNRHAPNGVGRPLDDIPEVVVHEIQRYMHKHGQAPSSNWVYQMTRQALSTGGFNRSKARRAIQAATIGAGGMLAASVGR